MKSKTLYWKSSRHGWLTTASALNMITEHNKISGDENAWIWKIEWFPKVKNFLRKLIQKGLPAN